MSSPALAPPAAGALTDVVKVCTPPSPDAGAEPRATGGPENAVEVPSAPGRELGVPEKPKLPPDGREGNRLPPGKTLLPPPPPPPPLSLNPLSVT